MHTPYERMQHRAYNIIRKSKIKDFSLEELHRAFKHCKEKLLYTSIVRNAVENGLTIHSLYEQEHDHGMSR